MREIKFRGRPFHESGFVTGYLCMEGKESEWCVITDDEGVRHHVDSETVGQYTGYSDSHEKEIYEGDIVKFLYKPMYPFGDSEFDEVVICKVAVCITGKFILEKSQSDEFEESLYNAVNYDDELTVIGNIHDNPELIEVEE